MIIKHDRFEVIKWEVDSAILNPNINPEVDFFSINIEDYISFQILTDKLHNLQLAHVTISWFYAIQKKMPEKKLLLYNANDAYSVAMDFFLNESAELRNAITDSYKRYSDEFDNRKVTLGIQDGLPVLDASEVNQIYLDIKKRLMS